MAVYYGQHQLGIPTGLPRRCLDYACPWKVLGLTVRAGPAQGSTRDVVVTPAFPLHRGWGRTPDAACCGAVVCDLLGSDQKCLKFNHLHLQEQLRIAVQLRADIHCPDWLLFAWPSQHFERGVEREEAGRLPLERVREKAVEHRHGLQHAWDIAFPPEVGSEWETMPERGLCTGSH